MNKHQNRSQFPGLRISQRISLKVIISIGFVVLFSLLLSYSRVLATISHCGTLSTDETWSSSENVHTIGVDCENVTVPVGVTLTITEGTIVKVDFNDSLIVDGTLIVQGSEANPVYFTSYRDDAIGGDTNGDGASTGQRGDWHRIEFTDFSNDASMVDYAIIRYGGDSYYANQWGGINILSASPTIQNTELTENEYAGITINSSTPVLGCNNIYNNSDYGIYNTTPGVSVIAENQWWGTISGPYHPNSNPTGTGNEVSDGVDFSPWSLHPCFQPPTYGYIIFLPFVNKP